MPCLPAALSCPVRSHGRVRTYMIAGKRANWQKWAVPCDAADDGRMEFLLTLRRRGIGDQAVLRAMDEVPREQFVDAEFSATSAYADQAPAHRLRADHQPALCRRLHDRAARRLGRSTACSRSAPAPAIRRRCSRGWRAKVMSIERYRTLAQAARARLAALGYDNVEVVVGDGLDGVPERAPSTASSSRPPPSRFRQTLLDQLARRRRHDAAARAA